MVVKIDLTNFLFMIKMVFLDMYVVSMLSISSRQGIFFEFVITPSLSHLFSTYDIITVYVLRCTQNY
jgi:hypothetical protein